MQNADMSPNLEGMRSIADIPKLGDTILSYYGGCDELNSRIAE
jgi:hypothetical protein